MKCVNCTRDAMYVYDVPATDTVAYCEVCLPSFLRVQAKAGLLQITERFTEVQSEVAEKLAPKKAKATVDIKPIDDEAPAGS